MSCLELAHRNGQWVILNNIHLMPNWLIELEKKLDEFAIEGSHEKFRLYLSSDPSAAIPIGVLSRCIKLTNEPPAGLKANLKRAFANFSREYIEEVTRDSSQRTKHRRFSTNRVSVIDFSRRDASERRIRTSPASALAFPALLELLSTTRAIRT